MKKQTHAMRLSTAFLAMGLCLPSFHAQGRASSNGTAELRVQIATAQRAKHHSVPAVVWLDPVGGTPAAPLTSDARYSLLQKNRAFIPHLQVVPLGASVHFPNEDPFFHNVFSLFDGKRFDLGLYEAGSSKAVTFSREGVSYIFCNIHPEMSAVVISIPTRLYAIADADESIELRNIPPGEYRMQIWVEGIPQSILQQISRNVQLTAGVNNLGAVSLPVAPKTEAHTNKFGRAYDQTPQNPY